MLTTSYPSQPGDGAGHFVAAEVEDLLAAGHEVHAFVPRAAAPRQDPRIRLHELPHLDLFGWPGALPRLRSRPDRALGALVFCRQLRRALAKAGPFELVRAHFLLPCGWPVLRDYVGEAVLIGHGSDLRLLERLPAPLRRRILKGWNRPGLRLELVSEELATRLRQLAAGRALAPVTVVPARLALPMLPERQRVLARLSARLAAPLEPGEFCVLLVGRLIPTKGTGVALAAALRYPQLRAVVVGDGPERRRLERAFPRAEFLGQLSRVETLEWLLAADLLLSGSRLEGAPTAIREARALGTPVLSLASGDLHEWAKTDPGLWVVD